VPESTSQVEILLNVRAQNQAALAQMRAELDGLRAEFAGLIQAFSFTGRPRSKSNCCQMQLC
jgi:hypothetical protein